MGYTLLGINMGRASKFFRLVAHLGAWWMVLDCFTTITYWTLCQEGKLECWMWPLGALFLVLPTILSTLITFTCGWPHLQDLQDVGFNAMMVNLSCDATGVSVVI